MSDRSSDSAVDDVVTSVVTFVQDLADESHIEYPLEGDDYGDELEAYMYGEEGRSRGRKRRR